MNQKTSAAAAPERLLSKISPCPALPPTASRPPISRYIVIWRILTFGLRVRWKRAFLFWCRFAANPLLTIRWWRFIAAFAATHELPPPHDELLQKPLSKFLVHRMPNSRRLSLLIEHFSIAETILSRDSMIRLWRGEWLEMGTVQGKCEAYACHLALADRSGGRHEGAFAIKLLRVSDQAVLCTARFTFVYQGTKGRYTFVVGSMQGPRNAKQRIIEVTRDLAGLRPKEAILIVLQGLAAEGGMQHFLAVSQARHPIQYRRRSRQSMLLSNIDAFWLERSGEPECVYGFQIPHSKIQREDRRSQKKSWFLNIGELFH
ncbi:DUF535 family protein [Rhizobium sp. AG207R]|nr:DUF535 family protein [Rhizobium sp. AG207R]TWB14251.1 hypothetical protein FBZ99_1044 [Rhizobium sp. ERR1071]